MLRFAFLTSWLVRLTQRLPSGRAEIGSEAPGISTHCPTEPLWYLLSQVTSSNKRSYSVILSSEKGTFEGKH